MKVYRSHGSKPSKHSRHQHYRWKWTVRFILQLFYPHGKESPVQFPLDMMGVFQS